MVSFNLRRRSGVSEDPRGTLLVTVFPKTYICTFRTHRISKARRDFAQEGFLARTVLGTAGVAVTAALSSIQDLRDSDFPWLTLSSVFECYA